MSTQNPTPDATATPRTDEATAKGAISTAILCKKLETELAAAKAEIAALRIEYESRADWIARMLKILGCENKDGLHYRDPHNVAQELMNERDQLRAEVERLNSGIVTRENVWETQERDQLRARVAELEADKARHLTILKEAHEKIQTYAKRQGKTRMAGKSFGDGTKRNPQVGQHYPAIQSLIGSINTALSAARARKGAT